MKAAGISKTYYSEKGIFLKKTSPKNAVKNVSFVIEEGECAALVGESGSGKSTLARILSGLERPERGDVFIGDKSVFEMTPLFRAQKVGIVFQNPSESLNPRRTAGSILRETASFARHFNSEISFDEVLSLFSLDRKILNSRPSHLSGGQSQRVALARALLLFPEFLILDEVTSALDISTVAKIVGILKEINRKFSMGILFITHDIVLATVFCSKIFVMKDGEIVEKGDAQEIFNFPKHSHTIALKEALI